jgi:hypothetical protein
VRSRIPERPLLPFHRAILSALLIFGVSYTPQVAQGQSSVTGERVECTDGTADQYPCENIDLLSVLSIDALGGDADTALNDVWGWTDPQTGTEYALVGRTDGTAFVDVSTPTKPIYVGALPTHTVASTWRDVKVHDHHAYVVADNAGEHGMQVFDLTRLRDVDAADAPVTFDHDELYERVHSAHNVAINTETGYAYVVGGSDGGTTCGGGLHMINIQDPQTPTFAGCFPEHSEDSEHSGHVRSQSAHAPARLTGPSKGSSDAGSTHDAQCVTYRGPDADHRGDEICFNANETVVNIANVTDKDAPVTIAEGDYPNVGFVHQAWLTKDHRYLYVDDEFDERQANGIDNTRTIVLDVTDLENPKHVTSFLGSTGAIDHNQYIEGTYSYQANYTSGLRVLDVADPENPDEAAFFDTVPSNDNPTFDGAWSTYPFFDQNVVLVSSIEEGLFVVQPEISPFLSFTSTQQEQGVQLRWSISATAQTAHIDVEHKPPEATDWQVDGTREGRGDSKVQNYDFSLDDLRPGTHQFRLRHVSTRGTVHSSATRSVGVLPSAPVVVEGPAPNPTRNQSVVRLTLRETQNLRVGLYDVTGRRVRLLHDGPVDASVIQRFQVRASRRASGPYFLRVRGESVQILRKIVIAR